jgi:hypothetical protein
MSDPCYDVAHLGHVELYTDKFEDSLDFFVRVFCLTESGREGDSVYLRAFDDYEFHSLKLTRHHTTGLGHVGYRVSSPRPWRAASKQSKPPATASAGPTAISATAAPIVSPIPTGISSSSTGIRSNTTRPTVRSRPSGTSPSAITAAAPVRAGSIT